MENIFNLIRNNFVVIIIIVISSIALFISTQDAYASDVIDQGDCGENVTWNLSDDGTLVISGSGKIPYNINKPNPWQKYSESITTIIINDGIESISAFVFSKYYALTGVSIPNSVTSIGECAFSNCINLTDITLPDNITSIGADAFRSCCSLTNITIPNGLQRIENGLFNDCTYLESITIPNSVTYIGDRAFKDCRYLKSITISESVSYISNYDTFLGCDSELLFIVADTNSYAQSYLKDHGFRYDLISGHSYGNWTITQEATCEGSGIKERICSTCGNKIEEVIPELGHKLVHYNETLATCTKNGHDAYDKCSRCGYEPMGHCESIATGHIWEHYKKAAGLLKNGTEYDFCAACKTKKNVKTLKGYATYYVKSLKVAKAKKAFTVKWAKQSSANQKKFNGYQIRYALKKNMGGAKTVYAAKSSKSKKISKLKAKKTYYVQVRTYTKKNGITFYSKWSAKKSVKTK